MQLIRRKGLKRLIKDIINRDDMKQKIGFKKTDEDCYWIQIFENQSARIGKIKNSTVDKCKKINCYQRTYGYIN